MLDVKATIKEAENKMQASVDHLEDTFDHIRAGRATVKLLDGIKAECYGSMMEISRAPTVQRQMRRASSSSLGTNQC